MAVKTITSAIMYLISHIIITYMVDGENILRLLPTAAHTSLQQTKQMQKTVYVLAYWPAHAFHASYYTRLCLTYYFHPFCNTT